LKTRQTVLGVLRPLATGVDALAGSAGSGNEKTGSKTSGLKPLLLMFFVVPRAVDR